MSNNQEPFYYALECDEPNINQTLSTMSSGNEYYCSSCFSKISCDLPSIRSRFASTNAQDQLLLDGIDHQTVIATADRLYPVFSPRKLSLPYTSYKTGHSDNVLNRSSHSSKSEECCTHKQDKINKDPIAFSKQDGITKAAEECLPLVRAENPLAKTSVSALQPAHTKERQRGYEKQELTGYSHPQVLEAQRDQLQRTADTHTKPRTPLKSPVKVRSDLQTYCYCRAEDDGTEMLRCSAELCSIG